MIILGILATVVVYAVGDSRTDTVDASCRTDRRVLMTAQEAHQAQYGEFATEQELVDHRMLRRGEQC